MDKVVIVTGGSRGIGRAISLRLAEMGWAIVINYRSNDAEAMEVASHIERAGGSALAIEANVGVAGEFTDLFDQGENAFGKIDALINNAGIIRPSFIKDLSDAAIDEQIEVNLRGTIYGMREAARRLADGGHIINFSSTTLALNPPTYGVYNATKAAVEALTRVAAKELGPRRIAVNTIAPGPVDTDLFIAGKSQMEIDRMADAAPFKRLGQPKDISDVVAFLLSAQGAWINGQIIRVNGGIA